MADITPAAGLPTNDLSKAAVPTIDSTVELLDEMRTEMLAEAEDLQRRASAIEYSIGELLSQKANILAAREAALAG